MPDIIFSVMQKPFIKRVIRQRVGRFLHSRKNLLGVFKKKTAVKRNRDTFSSFKNYCKPRQMNCGLRGAEEVDEAEDYEAPGSSPGQEL
jgi:hypothetical protein